MIEYRRARRRRRVPPRGGLRPPRDAAVHGRELGGVCGGVRGDLLQRRAPEGALITSQAPIVGETTNSDVREDDEKLTQGA